MLNTITPQVKVTLPEQLYFHLKSKADRFDMTMSSYVRNLILNDVKNQEIPVFKMSKETEEKGLKALEEYQQGKTIKITDVDEFFRNL